jgi:hypothetical protein
MLPDSLLNTIGEYGMARTDRVSQLEVTHRWQLLIAGIKAYASDYGQQCHEAGRQQGMWQERALWQMARDALESGMYDDALCEPAKDEVAAKAWAEKLQQFGQPEPVTGYQDSTGKVHPLPQGDPKSALRWAAERSMAVAKELARGWDDCRAEMAKPCGNCNCLAQCGDTAAWAAEQAVPAEQAHGQLDPRSAADFARTIIGFSDSFNGQAFSSVFDSDDRQNLAMALDYLTEAGAMLLNLADRVSPATERRPLTESELRAEFKRLQQDYEERLVMDLPDFIAGAEFAQRHFGITAGTTEQAKEQM